jgi:prevent-host-death family protein
MYISDSTCDRMGRKHVANLSTVEARSQFADLINRVAYGKEQVILTRRGKALVAVVPIEQMQILDAAIRAIHIQQFPLSDAHQHGSQLDSDHPLPSEVAKGQEHV